MQYLVPDSRYYAEDVKVADPEGQLTNAQLAQWVADLKEALGLANADRAALRTWKATVQEKSK